MRRPHGPADSTKNPLVVVNKKNVSHGTPVRRWFIP
jgi:hypothetical protein